MKKRHSKRSGYSHQLTRQIGEHLVVAKLGRMGYIASPFAGNVPLFDILAADKRGHAFPIQVKATYRGGGWQYKTTDFLDMEFDRVTRFQHNKGKKRLPNPDLICIFVLLDREAEAQDEAQDEFFIFQLRDLQEYTFKITPKRQWRKKNPESMHCAVKPKDLQELGFKDNWQLITAHS